MRNAFAEEISHLAGRDERVVLLSGDIGNRLFNNYKAEFPKRFYNCGIAEANMTGVAAGMALCGLRPVTYTITAFNTLRCVEQIRVDICYQNLPVVIVGVGSGLCYASLNVTHHALEDIAFMRALPNMTVICPGDVWEVQGALRAALQHHGPVYIRLGIKNEPVVHKEMPEFAIGKSIVICPGDDLCLLSTGNMLPTAVEVSEQLRKKGLSAQVISFHTVKPLDENMLTHVFSKHRLVATMEEHSILGGFGSSVAEWLVDQPSSSGRLCRFGTADKFLRSVGNQQNARELVGLTPNAVVEKILDVLQHR